VAARLPLGHSVTVVPGLLAFTHVHNRGVAFGLLDGVSVLVPAVVTLTLLLLLFYNKARWIRRPMTQAAFALLGGGAASNLLDRIRVGAVVDFIDVHIWPIFNLADAAVSVGALLLVLTLLRGE